MMRKQNKQRPAPACTPSVIPAGLPLRVVGRGSKRESSGFTLFESLIALTVIVVAVAGLVGSFNKASSYNRICHARYVASQLTTDKIENLRQMSYADMTAVSSGSDQITLEGIDFTRQWTVSDAVDDPADGPGDTDPDDYRQIFISVTWSQAGRNNLQLSLNSIRTK